jgi:hypothetical protein
MKLLNFPDLDILPYFILDTAGVVTDIAGMEEI